MPRGHIFQLVQPLELTSSIVSSKLGGLVLGDAAIMLGRIVGKVKRQEASVHFWSAALSPLSSGALVKS